MCYNGGYVIDMNFVEKHNVNEWVGYLGINFYYVPVGFTVVVKCLNFPDNRLVEQHRVYKPFNG